MIQDTYMLFKRFFKIHDNLDDLVITSDSFQAFSAFCMSNARKLPMHRHNDCTCRSSNIRYVFSYRRNYIIYIDGKVSYSSIDIPVFYCENCEHYHALLSYMILVPYQQYSLPFILLVLMDRLHHHMSISDIQDKYGISASTLYRWIHKYQKYYRMFLMIRNQAMMDFFLALLMAPAQFLKKMFSLCGTTLFQSKRRISSNPSG